MLLYTKASFSVLENLQKQGFIFWKTFHLIKFCKQMNIMILKFIFGNYLFSSVF